MKPNSDPVAPLKLDRFEVLVDTWGCNTDRWPAEYRPAAALLLERSEEARGLLVEAERLDALLDQAPALEPSPALRQRILAAAPKAQKRSWWQRLDSWTEQLWPFTPRWQPAAALVTAAIMGIVLGASLPTQNGEDDTDDVNLNTLAFGVDLDWSEQP